MRTAVAFAALLMACGLVGCACGPSIDGQYELVSRDLPDGTVQHSPQVMGWMSLDDGLRVFHVYWKDASGKATSLGSVAHYKLEKGQYSETNLYYIELDGINGKPVVYDVSGNSGSSAVAVEDGRVKFKLPLHDEPAIVFTKDGVTASRPGAFVDHWKKISD